MEYPVDYVWFVLSGLYSLLICAGIASYATHLKKKFISVVFILAFELGCWVRAVFFVIQPFILSNNIVPPAINFVLSTVPSFFFFSTYMVLLMLWGEIYLGSYQKSTFEVSVVNVKYMKKQRSVLGVINIIMYVIVTVILSLDIYTEGISWKDPDYDNPNSPFEYALLTFASFMYITTTVGFFIYGYIVYKNLFQDQTIARSYYHKKLLRKIALVSIICIVCFVARALLTVLQFTVKIIAQSAWVAGAYYLAVEIFPLSLMLYVLRISSRTALDRDTSLNPTSPLIT